MATESQSYRQRLVSSFFQPRDIASLAAFRILFGAFALALVGRYFAHGWIEDFYLRPQVFFPYPGLEWIRPFPAGGMYTVFALLGLAAAGILVGFSTRLSAALFCVGFTYVHLIDRTNYLNHYYLISLLSFLLAFLPSGGAVSFDVRLGRVRRQTSTPAWTIWVLRFQLAVVYFFAGVAKLDHDWLIEAQPLRTWLAAWAEAPLIGAVLGLSITAHLGAIAGAVFDLSIPFLLLWRRTRALAYAAVVVFHGFTAVLFPSIGLFPWLMTALTPIFFAPDWPRHGAVLGRLFTARHAGQGEDARRRRPVTPPDAPGGDGAPPSTRARARPERAQRRESRDQLPSPGVRRAMLLGLACYAAIQIALPLRFLAFPGNVLWTEQGFRFAWRVMLMEKYGHAELVARDPRSGREWHIDPSQYLTPLQVYMMSTQPDMILSFGRWLGERWRAQGYDQIEVHANVQVSLNGRPHQPLIDLGADLVAPDASVATIVSSPHTTTRVSM